MPSDTPSGSDEPRGVPAKSRVPAEMVEEIIELREVVDQLKEAVTSHAMVDQAIGIVVALGRVTPDEGWAVLREVSQLTNIKLRNIAELVLIWGRNGDLPSDIRVPLEEALDKYGPTEIPGAPSHP
ncbi:ANTAR domain protein [Actinobacteria bacterium OK006]|nr:ANTAR domain protein [Actinobacteria bacterium OK006]